VPLYEYQCEKCGHRFESIRKVSDPPPDGCPQCGGAVHKLQSAPAFQFKGSGWYITDYARKDQGGTAKGEGGAAKDESGAKDSGAKETAAESKDTSKTEKAASDASPSKPTTPASS